MDATTRERVLSGMQPSGRLHLGNWMGALDNWCRLQHTYECFFFVANWHALSTNYEDTAHIPEYTREMVLDWLAAGLDPQQCTLFVQSQVLEHGALHVLLSMITPISWLERNPTYKEKRQELQDRDLSMYGFLGYPVLQAADILIYKAQYVPVGVDQLPHLEITREIARRFNHLYRPVFPEPQALLTDAPKVPGTDGRKMSKSYRNCVYLSDPPDVVEKKILTMVTDPQRVRRSDPGNPDVCPVFDLHKIFTPPGEHPEIIQGCRTAAIGCVDCKRILLRHLKERLDPLWDRRAFWSQRPGEIQEILQEGAQRARGVAAATLQEAEEAMHLR